MVEYNARWEEFEKGIREAEAKDYQQVGDQPAETLPITTRATGLSRTLSTYMDWRDRALQEGLQILDEESTSITGSAQQARWVDYFSRKGQEALKTILDSVKDYDVKKVPNLRRFGEDAAGQESQFFAQLARAPLAWFQGQVQNYTLEFYKEMNSLEGKWKSLGDQDRSADDKFKQTSNQILSLLQNTVAEFISKERGLEDNARLLTKKLKDAPSGTIPSEIKYPLQVIDWLLERLAALRKSTEEYTRALQDSYRYEDTIVVMFTQTREMVGEFMEKTNLRKAIEEFNESSKNSLEMASQCPTSGQRSDAKRFIEKGIAHVEEFLTKFKQEYSEFVGANRGIFVGPVNEKTIEELLEIQEKRKTWEELEGFNIQTKLKEFHQRCITMMEVDLEGLTEEQKKELKEFLRSEVERLGRGVVAASEDTLWDRLKTYYTSAQMALAEKVKSSKGGEE